MGFKGVGVSLGTYLGGCRGEGGGTAVDTRASSKAARATWYGVEETWGLGGGLIVVRGVVGARLDEGGEGGGVSNGGWGEASLLRHLSASQSHGGNGGWSPNRRSSGRSPQPHSSSRKEGLEGIEEARLRGLDEWPGEKRGSRVLDASLVGRRRGDGGTPVGGGRPRLLVDRASDGPLWMAEACP